MENNSAIEMVLLGSDPLYASKEIKPLSDWTLAIEVCSNGKALTDCLIWPFVREMHSFLLGPHV